MKQIVINNIPIELEKKRIKNMYLRILPPDGRVRISAPVKISEEEINRFVTSKMEWIGIQQEKIKQRPIIKPLEYMTGEEILVWGREYELIVNEGKYRDKVLLEGNKIILFTREGSSIKKRVQILNDWYKGLLQEEIPMLISKWEKIIGVKSNDWNIRNMKTRWGTCNIYSGDICLNLQLATKPPRCLEYVVVHELTHLLERNHNSIFKGYLDHFLPQWRSIKRELNNSA